mmetsp:Transcript_4288/g.6557  ORF Transcript_4288/g.6557 Transcript_4288/m.6557 type:complete len:221 (-) Transcript_4288:51-713(-)
MATVSSKYNHIGHDNNNGDSANVSLTYKGDVSKLNLFNIQYNMNMNIYGPKTSLNEDIGCELYKGLTFGAQFQSPLINGASLAGYCPIDFDHSKLLLAMGYTYNNYFMSAKTQYDICDGKTNFTGSLYSKQGDLEAALQGKYTLYADKPELAIAAKYNINDKTYIKGTISDNMKARALVSYICGGGVTANVGISINPKAANKSKSDHDTFKMGTKFIFSS